MTGQTPDAPEGFDRHFRTSAVTDPWEPIYSRVLDASVEIGLILREPHCNTRGRVHGGVIATLADNAMGLSCVQKLSSDGRAPKSGLVTVSLGVDYQGSAEMGSWLLVRPEVTRAGSSICFVRALVTANDRAVASAHATFKVL